MKLTRIKIKLLLLTIQYRLFHIYVFDIAQIIKKIFINDQKYSQVFIFTHSLHFFHELIKILKVKKQNLKTKSLKLLRLIKNENGSELKSMNLEEIQNDYQSFWQIIKDVNQPPALIANCMRHIIEYFFGFIEKIELNEVLKMLEKKDLNINKYEAFFRYMNRESHSDGVNIFDNGEFEHGCFKEAFKLVFEESGYINHYYTMIS